MIRFVRTGSFPALTDGGEAGLSDRVERKEFFAKAVKERKDRKFSADLSGLVRARGLTALRDAAEGMILGTFVPERFPQKPREEWEMELAGLSPEGETVVRETEALMEGVFWVRDMTNRPGNLLRPGDFAGETRRLLEGLPVELEILDAARMEELGMGGVLGIGMSSAYRPCLCILRYRGGHESDGITGLVGKGVTCDSGGYCLKSASSMLGIKGDMAGGAAVAGTIYALAKNHVPVNVTGVIPMAENRISDGSLLPGDVITSYSGRTIEVQNTDAEGRLILADAVTWAVRDEHVSRVLDIATLTGSICTTLAFGAAGAVCDDEELFRDFQEAYELSGERYVRLPIYREYEKMIESDIADVKNMGGKFAGTITAGLFIRMFADGIPWIHLDIAGSAWVDPPVFEYQSKGASGAGLTTMYYLCAGKKPARQIPEPADEREKIDAETGE